MLLQPVSVHMGYLLQTQIDGASDEAQNWEIDGALDE